MIVKTKTNSKRGLEADVHSRLRNRIVSYELKPGTRLTEDELCVLLDCGRTPVRESLLRLEGEGLVTRDRGWVVKGAEPSYIHELFETRIAIESFAARLAAQRATAKEIDDLYRLTAQMADLEKLDMSTYTNLNRIFHNRLSEIAHNRTFIEISARTHFYYWNLQTPVLVSRQQLEVANADHIELVRAIKAHDEDRAEVLARNHVNATYEVVLSALGIASPRVQPKKNDQALRRGRNAKSHTRPRKAREQR